jgi:type IV conjugative transfer system coupling protein TraD
MGLIASINEGGQTTAHKVRMFRQVLRIAVLLGSVVALGSCIFNLKGLPSSFYEGSFYAAKVTVAAKCGIQEVSIPGWVMDNVDKSKNWPRNSEVKVGPEKILPKLNGYSSAWMDILLVEARKSFLLATSTIFGCLSLFGLYGVIRRRDRHLSGRKIRSPKLVRAKLFLSRSASPIKIGEIPMVKGTETQHLLITGGTGSGKTNCLKQLLDQLAKRNEKVVVVDPTGDLASCFFSKARGDILLNPLDPRSAEWCPWAECQNEADIHSFSEALIPISSSQEEEYWREGSRSILTALMQEIKDQKLSTLTNWIMREPLGNLTKILSGTNAASFVDLSAEKTAGSMRSVCARFTKPLSHLPDTTTPFIIRKWIQCDKPGWLFLTCKPDERAMVKGLLRAWLSLAIRSLQALPIDLNRRRWFVIDELPALDRIDALQALVCESRKYGGCAALALQSPAQLQEIYGRSLQRTITGNCATRVVFSEKDSVTAKEISQCLGDRELQEQHEGISYGAHEMRDGVSISSQKRSYPCVPPHKIMSLQANYAYVILPGNISISKTKINKTN